MGKVIHVPSKERLIPRENRIKAIQDLYWIASERYEVPESGIPATDLSADVQEAINKAENAVSTPEGAGSPGQVLQLDSEGVPSWTTPSAGTVPDAELSETSTNAVQNKVIAKEFKLLDIKLYGFLGEKTYSTTAGTAINTTPTGTRLFFSRAIQSGKKFKVVIDYANSNKRVTLYFYNGSSYYIATRTTDKELNFIAETNIDSIGFLIYANNTITGNVTLSTYDNENESVEEHVKSNRSLIDYNSQVTALTKVVKSTNLFNKNSQDNVTGYYIGGDGAIQQSNSYGISAPIALMPGESAISTSIPGTFVALYFSPDDYSKDNQYKIASDNSTLITNDLSIILYYRASYKISNINSFIINKGKTLLEYSDYEEVNVLYSDELNELRRDVSNIQSEISDTILTRTFNVTQGVALNTTSSSNRIYQFVKANTKFRIKIDYPEGTKGFDITTYFYKQDGTYSTAVSASNKRTIEAVFDFDVYSWGFNISAGNATANGTVTQSMILVNELTNVKNMSIVNKIQFSDILYHWLNGEKFPIAFVGDSTTDGTSTTGWSVYNSHPGKDAEHWLTTTEEGAEYEPDKTLQERIYDAHLQAKGRGTFDYIWPLAYPKLLEDLLKAELVNSNLRVYNIGYYGSPLNMYKSFDTIFGDVYSDTKAVGLVLGINDRTGNPADYYNRMVIGYIEAVEKVLSMGMTPFMVTNQVVTQNGNTGSSSYDAMMQDYIQQLCNKAKYYVAKLYGLEVLDMNNFGRLLLKYSSYSYNDLSEDLHFKDLGHKLEADFLFSEIIPWVNKSGNAKKIYFGFNCANSKTAFNNGRYDTSYTNDKFKYQINTERSESTNIRIFDAYMFVNAEDGPYSVTYHTPVASGYIVIDGDTDNPVQITNTEQTIGTWDIGLHHVQVYTGESTTVAFKGFLLEQNI